MTKAKSTSSGENQEKSTTSTGARASSLIPLTNSELDAIERRALAATPGRWSADATCEDGEYAVRVWRDADDEDQEPGIVAIVFDHPYEDQSSLNGEANVEFLANAPTDILRLLDVVKNLRDALEPFGADYSARFIEPQDDR